MPYRTNATKDDMIIELDDEEIKYACLYYIRNACNLYPKDDSVILQVVRREETFECIARIDMTTANDDD